MEYDARNKRIMERYGLTPEIISDMVARKRAKIETETSPTGCVNCPICHGDACIPYKLTRMSPDHTKLHFHLGPMFLGRKKIQRKNASKK